MKTVWILCGVHNSGKTDTLKAFFDVIHIKRLKPLQKLEHDLLNGKKIYGFGLSSPQELAMDAYRRKKENGFCKVEAVKPRIEKKIRKCKLVSHNENDILVVAFTMFVQDGVINERCIIEPIELLLSEGFEVFVTHLRRDEYFSDLQDALMEKIRVITHVTTPIESIKGQYNRQAKELEEIINKQLE